MGRSSCRASHEGRTAHRLAQTLGRLAVRLLFLCKLFRINIGVALGALPFYSLANRRLKSPPWSLAFAIAYLILPAIETGSVSLIIAAAALFGWALSNEQAPQQFAQFFVRQQPETAERNSGYFFPLKFMRERLYLVCVLAKSIECGNKRPYACSRYIFGLYAKFFKPL